jgi:hypothetical protein
MYSSQTDEGCFADMQSISQSLMANENTNLDDSGAISEEVDASLETGSRNMTDAAVMDIVLQTYTAEENLLEAAKDGHHAASSTSEASPNDSEQLSSTESSERALNQSNGQGNLSNVSADPQEHLVTLEIRGNRSRQSGQNGQSYYVPFSSIRSAKVCVSILN